ncbi:cyclin-dependent kinase-like 4 [Xylocopa sonorina]|uniref:cyclin-dependent kinase-like 4 n=1 Tax=Xylocopa sonorina TaxID=1818115 RepID=UPI00403A94D6
MDKYEMIEIVGGGSYGVVMKCRHRESGQLVAIKRFLETEEDYRMRKMAFREISMLKKLHHENLVNMIEVFRQRKRFYLVFEYLDHTLLEELERVRHGLGWEVSKRHVYQILQGLDFCHSSYIIHRDIKPENILVSLNGVIKLCDFGFARFISGTEESCTDYVATRWYRAPELLVGDLRYGKAIDIWAVGCLYAEMVNGDPLFPGDSDVDQLYRITKVLGGLCTKHRAIMGHNTPGQILRHANADELVGPPQSSFTSVRRLFPTWDILAVDFLARCLRMDPALRPECSVLLQHAFFMQNNFLDNFLVELRDCIVKESVTNPLATKRFDETRSCIPAHPFESRKRTACCKNVYRWHMTVPKRRSTNHSRKQETSKPTESPKLRLNHARKFCGFDPVSVVPNTTYVKKLKNKGFVPVDKNTCTFSLDSSSSNDERKI